MDNDFSIYWYLSLVYMYERKFIIEIILYYMNYMY